MENVMIFVVINQKIYDLGPILECLAGADEKIFFVENVKNLIFELFDKERFFLKQTKNKFASSFHC